MLRSVLGKRVSVSLVAAAASIALTLWPAVASGGHSSSSVAVSPLAGSLDPSFGSGGMIQNPESSIGEVALQPDGKIVVGGGSSSGLVLTRYLPNGSLDPSFGTGGYVETDLVDKTSFALALQPDRKIVVAEGSTYGSANQFTLARFNSDGSPDTSFGTDGSTTTVIPYSPGEFWTTSGAGVATVAVLPDGKILATGSALWHGPGLYEEDGGFVLAQYTAAGSLDPAFGDGGIVEAFDGGTDAAAGMVVLPQGQIVATGTSYGGHPDYPSTIALAGYQADGSSDFEYPFAPPTIGRLSGGPAALQRGKIVVAGSIRHSNKTFPVVARYGADGLLDSTFGKHGYAEVKRAQFAPSAVLTQTDGKIVIAGYSGNPNSDGTVVRLLPNGQLDPSLGRGGIVSIDPGVSSLALQPDGKILVGGEMLDRLLGGNNCAVPRLRGMTIPKAGAKLKASHCRTGRISKLFSNRIPRGHVISTTPPPGDRRPAGTKIDLVVSRGRPSHRS